MSAFSVSVSVPATTANLGPGFDCLGAALTLYNRFSFSLRPGGSELEIQVRGQEAERVKTNSSNLAYQAFVAFYQYLNQAPPPVQIQIQLGVPLARGLGSSATAIVGGLVGANALAGSPLETPQILKLAIALEGHPDNVAPALLGGCRLAASGLPPTEWTICDIPWSESIMPVVAIPEFELSTQAARAVLPQTCNYQDAIFNTAHLGLLLRGLETGNPDWLRSALQDRLHQPYRQSLILGFEAVQAAALESGAYGLVISGAGPTLLALADAARAKEIAAGLQTTWQDQGITAEVKLLQVAAQGATTTAV